MNKCFNCQKETKNPKYCSSKCSAVIRNRNYYAKRAKKEYFCKRCTSLIQIGYTNKKYCEKCNNNIVDWFNISLCNFKKRFKNIFQMHARIRDIARRNYKRSKNPKYCMICHYDKFYEVCHIKAIKDFSPESTIAEVNHIDNLIALCPNCHWELDHKLIIL